MIPLHALHKRGPRHSLLLDRLWHVSLFHFNILRDPSAFIPPSRESLDIDVL